MQDEHYSESPAAIDLTPTMAFSDQPHGKPTNMPQGEIKYDLPSSSCLPVRWCSEFRVAMAICPRLYQAASPAHPTHRTWLQRRMSKVDFASLSNLDFRHSNVNCRLLRSLSNVFNTARRCVTLGDPVLTGTKHRRVPPCFQ